MFTANLTGDSALRTRMVVLHTRDQGKVYVHKALLHGQVTGFYGCTWFCFPSTVVTRFVEYLYQVEYNPPPAAGTNPDAFEWDSNADEERCE